VVFLFCGIGYNDPMKSIQGILLAAGAGERFGGHKLLHPLSGGELIGIAAARNLINSLPKTLAVIRQGDDQLAEQFEALGLQVVENRQAELGMGESLSAGIDASFDAAGWVVALADMPWISPDTICSLVQRLEQGASICAPVFQGRRGHPVAFGGQWRNQLKAMQGDHGARHLLKANQGELVLIATDDRGVILDIDRHSDLANHDSQL
jgi:molybdenum cofactor cytidylyltransferase